MIKLEVGDVVAVSPFYYKPGDKLCCHEVGVVRYIYPNGAFVEFAPRSDQGLDERYCRKIPFRSFRRKHIAKINESLNFDIGESVVIDRKGQGTIVGFEYSRNRLYFRVKTAEHGRQSFWVSPRSIKKKFAKADTEDFKVGDRIVLSDAYNKSYCDYIGCFHAGDAGTVVEIDSHWIGVEFDNHEYLGTGVKWPFGRNEYGIFPFHKEGC